MTDLDIGSCDREPIHIPGAILPHGALLVLDGASLEILQAAGNTRPLIGAPPAELLGVSLGRLLRAEQCTALLSLARRGDLAKPRHLLDPALRILEDQPVDASVHRAAGCLVVEFEPADLGDPHAADPLAAVQEMLDGLETAPSLREFCQLAAARVRAVAGYDRVMIYRFLKDDSGCVFAESRREDLKPYLDLHYPASDIPVQARALYLKSWVRLITQVDYEPAPLVPLLNPRTGQPLDMSLATLRDVSPIHREYLRNMGVDASMSISIIREGRLWGLIACHHDTPRVLPRHLRAICELFGAMFSLQLESRERAELFEARLASRQLLQKIMTNLAADDDYVVGLVRQSPSLLDYIDSEGVLLRAPARGGIAISVNSKITVLGRTPSEPQILALADWLANRMSGVAGDGIFATDRLGELWSPAKAFADVGSGLLAVSVSREAHDFIFWFRPEIVQTVDWGGNPEKPVESSGAGQRLTPRKSFEIWRETVRGRSRPWRAADSDAAFDLRVSLLEVVLRRIDAAARERARAHEQERLLMAELDHRVKNTLASIQALVMQSSRSAESLAQYATGLEHRIHSMAKAHSLLTQSRWQGVLVGSLIEEELRPYQEGRTRIETAGPPLTLTPKAALALALAVHELTTNAAKYGALSCDGGKVAIHWTTPAAGGIELLWTETGGPPVAPPTRRGFGSTLIERALAMETDGQSLLTFEPGGVRCRILLPAASLGASAPGPDPKAAAIATPGAAGAAAPMRQRIFIVEDSSLVAMTLEAMMHELGWELVGPATRLPEALLLAHTAQMDAALIDINLDGAMSWEVARQLKQRRVPFAFTTGYDGGVVPADLGGAVVLNKPYRIHEVELCLRDLIAGRPHMA